MKKVTRGKKGGRGSKIWYFHGDVIFEWFVEEQIFYSFWLFEDFGSPSF